MDESTYEENLSQPLKSKNKQFKIAVTVLTGYNGVSNGANKNYKFIFISVFEGAEYNVITNTLGAYELETLNAETKWNVIDEG